MGRTLKIAKKKVPIRLRSENRRSALAQHSITTIQTDQSVGELIKPRKFRAVALPEGTHWIEKVWKKDALEDRDVERVRTIVTKRLDFEASFNSRRTDIHKKLAEL